MLDRGKRYYFLGIAGQVMSGLAMQLKHLGYVVSGVAVNAYPPSTTDLAEANIPFYTEYHPDHIQPDTVIILANDIPLDNLELGKAQQLGLTIWSFPELVELLSRDQQSIVIAGTHGKTTTTTLIAWQLDQAGLQPDFIIGMKGTNFGRSVRLQDSSTIVIEGDEYSASQSNRRSKFLYYHPDILILTSLDWDHPDLFPSYDHVITAFKQLIASMPSDGLIVACADDPMLEQLLAHVNQTVIWYGQSSLADCRLVNISHQRGSFSLQYQGQIYQLSSPLVGIHNMLNTAAAFIVCRQLKVSAPQFQTTLHQFAGADRRFHLVGQVNQVTVIDDYAHHPNEIKATLQAARQRYVKQWRQGKLWACYQPHTYSRIQALLPQFASAFTSADHLLLLPIEAAREQAAAGITSSNLAQMINHPPTVQLVDNSQSAVDLLHRSIQPGDVVVNMSVRHNYVPQHLVAKLEQL